VSVLAAALEFLAYGRRGIFAATAGRIWAAHAVFYAISTLALIGWTLAQDVRGRRLLPVVVFAGLTALIFAGTAGIEHVNLNGEASQQVAEGLTLREGPDLGYTKGAFLAYPARQYVVAAVPSMLLGRGIWPLRLGYAIPFWAGMLVCYCGLRALFVSWGADTRVAAVTVLSFFTFPYVFWFLQRYEQTSLPPAFAMHVIGWGLLCFVKPTLFRFVNLLWPCGMAATTYTPGVAFWGLCLVFFLALAVKRWREHRPEALAWLGCAVFQTAVGCASLFVRLDLRLLPQQRDHARNFYVGLKILFFGDPYFFLSPILLFPILLYLLPALAFRFGPAHFAVGAWCLATFAVSIAAEGVASPSADLALQRSLVVVPVLVTGMAWAFQRWAGRRGASLSTAALWLLAGVLAIYSVQNLRRARSYFFVTPREAVIQDLIRQVERLGAAPESRLLLGFATDAGDLFNIHDFTLYFWPYADVVKGGPEVLPRVLKRLHETTWPAVVYVDRAAWSPAPAGLPADCRAEPFAHEGTNAVELVRLSRKGHGPS
jgi:hypothetical protein